MALSELLKKDEINFTFSKIFTNVQSTNIGRALRSYPISQKQPIVGLASKYMIQFLLHNLYPKKIIQSNYFYLKERYQIQRALSGSEDYIQMIEDTRRACLKTNLLAKTPDVDKTLESVARATFILAVLERAYYNQTKGSNWLVSPDRDDILDLLNITHNINFGKFKKYNAIYINPDFASVSLLVKRDPKTEVDFILDDTLLSIKNTTSPTFTKEQIYYLWAYYTILFVIRNNLLCNYPLDIEIIDANSIPEINNIGIFYSRFDYLLVIPVDILILNIQNSSLFSSFEEYIDWFIIQLIANENVLY